MYKLSKKFDVNIGFEELIKHNKTCKINLRSTHNFETYEGILIYVSHPENEEKFSVQLGVDEDGIMYEGDYGCREKYDEIPIKEGLDILIKYKEFIDTKGELEYLLLKNELPQDQIKIEFK